MAVEHFTREQFEAALPQSQPKKRGWWPGDYTARCSGRYGCSMASVVDKGEFIYSIPVTVISPERTPGTVISNEPEDMVVATYVNCYIAIRSSVREDGNSAGTGKDSIRLYLMGVDGPVASKLTKYITRVKGWEQRMTTQLRTLYKIGLSLKPCPSCGDLRHGFIAGKGKESTAQEHNKGRVFQKCVRVNARGKGLHGCEGSFEWIEFKEDRKCTVS